MQTQTIIAQTETVPSSTLAETLLDGASLYGIDLLAKGYRGLARIGIFSEGLIVPYGQGAPAWGSFEMFSDGVVGQDYDCQWDLTGASVPTTYEIVTGDLPDGLALESVSGNTGRIYGTPTTAGTFNFTLRASNEFGSADQAFSITIVSPPAGGGGNFVFIG